MRNINTKIFNLAIFQKLIFGIFTGIFVKNGGEKEKKLDILAKMLNYLVNFPLVVLEILAFL